jgi:hypothetical protein
LPAEVFLTAEAPNIREAKAVRKAGYMSDWIVKLMKILDAGYLMHDDRRDAGCMIWILDATLVTKK